MFNIQSKMWDGAVCYLLHSEQHHPLFGHVFRKHLEAEQHVRGGHGVQRVGRQEHALEAVLPHLMEEEEKESKPFSLVL